MTQENSLRRNLSSLPSAQTFLLGGLPQGEDLLLLSVKDPEQLEKYIQQEVKFVKYRKDHPARTLVSTWIVEPISRLLPEKIKKELLERLYKENLDALMLDQPIWMINVVNLAQLTCCVASTLQIQAKDLISAITPVKLSK